MENVKKLPDKPSDLIEVGLRDLEKIEKTPGYSVDMGDWHSFYADTEDSPVLCHVCLAGAVMAQTLGVPNDVDTTPYDMRDRIGGDKALANKLLALDSFRVGYVREGVCDMDIEPPAGMKSTVAVPAYSDDPKLFKASLRELAAYLRNEFGL